jgi:hypothetical protein
MNNQKFLYIIIGVLATVTVALASFILGGYARNNHMGFGMMYGGREESHESDETGKIDYNRPIADVHGDTFDFGKITRTGGVVSTTFEIENHGKKPLELGDISTSCGCTSAEVGKNKLEFDEHTDLTVFFDPDFHEEPLGILERSVFVPTNDPDLPELQFDISVEIVED